ncbi:zinc finger BED domain-containing protein 5-like [Toxorhynchites rutilus septentrionalis]|uniref:zinc finger BED domain-containing protein 5-like n=1 Tax=Toxorhynchites rutilus septentrionalis TaxID=329112 RepID=UPI0024798550|nr:zinc finger BED domain-containing protein 5-like [Toxorhynchites rutilus septentrionalis]
MQLDESTDVAGLAILMVFVRYQFSGYFEEDLLFCKPLPTATTGAEIFKLIDDYFTKNDIPWEHCVDVCTDGAKAMVGKTAGVVARIQEKAESCGSSHCILHRYALAMKKISPSLKEVLEESIKIINFIKARPKNSRLFKTLCDEMGSQYSTLLLHTEVRWLSRGKTLSRLFELRSEVRTFLSGHDFALGEKLKNDQWLIMLAYLADIFQKMNELSVSMQGRAISVFDVNGKILAFKRKIKFWTESLEKRNLDSFPNLNKIQSEISSNISSENFIQFYEHLQVGIMIITMVFLNNLEHVIGRICWTAFNSIFQTNIIARSKKWLGWNSLFRYRRSQNL